jgi:hypothetical protein
VLACVHKGVMSTDMAKHNAIVDSLKLRAEAHAAGARKGEEGGKVAEQEVRVSQFYDIEVQEDRHELIEAIVHASDLSGQVPFTFMYPTT